MDSQILPQPSFRFLDLPWDIRRLVYDKVIQPPRLLKSLDAIMGLLLANRQLSSETHEAYYGHRPFGMYLWPTKKLGDTSSPLLRMHEPPWSDIIIPHIKHWLIGIHFNNYERNLNSIEYPLMDRTPQTGQYWHHIRDALLFVDKEIAKSTDRRSLTIKMECLYSGHTPARDHDIDVPGSVQAVKNALQPLRRLDYSDDITFIALRPYYPSC